ncbi:MAG TPA: GatB/YqeY domain-containing protein [Acidobacteriaceae bacterium]|nr:GatB/YqeY domain-containing protein [Acidobacteriaceae bacterium]
MPEIAERLNKDIVVAMKAREEDKLTALRMVKSALKAKEIDKREPLTPAEEQSVLTTMLKQRRESVEQFTKGNRPELAAKEQAEIVLIEGYLPKAADEGEVRKLVSEAIEQITKDNGGTPPVPKDMGAVMKVAQQRILASGIRADGRMVSEMVKAALAKPA